MQPTLLSTEPLNSEKKNNQLTKPNNQNIYNG